MITIKEMAQMLGTSTTTVSNVIHGKTGEVSQGMVEKVERLLKEYEYVPNINARNLAKDKSKIIGVAMKYRKDKYQNFFTDPFTSELLGGIEECIRANGYFMMMYLSDDITEILKHVFTWNADGLLLFGMVGDDCMRIHKKYKKPRVYIDCYFDHQIVDYVNIGIDDEKAVYDITNHLIRKGHRRISFVADNCMGVDAHRYAGFCRAMREAGLSCSEEDFFMLRPGEGEIEISLNELYDYASAYTALVCASDYYAAMIMNEFQDRGMRVPEDISVTGFDDNWFSRMVRPMMTTVHQDGEMRGKKAVEVLISMLNNEKPEKNKILLPHEIVERDSVRNLTEQLFEEQ